MKTILLLSILCVTSIFASASFADCPTEMSFNKLVDCIAQEDSEPDITDLMTEAADNDMDSSIIQVNSTQTIIYANDTLSKTDE